MSFSHIQGQEGPIQFLQSAIKSARLSHAYLFVGPESIGKSLTARTLAKALNCQTEGLDSCDTCQSCQKIDKGVHPDISCILPEGPSAVIKIEKVRQLKNNIGLTPYEGRVKVYIIQRAHQMNEEAANSLLKVLEEPPPNSILILISEKPEKLFHTIKSRCQRVRFKAMSRDRLKCILKDGHGLTDDSSRFLAHFSSGRIGAALALKDRDTLEWKNEVINKFTMNNIPSGDDAFFFDNKREALLEMLDILNMWYRDILVLKSTRSKELLINKDRTDEIISKAASYSQDDLFNILEEIKKAGFLIQQNINPKLILSSLISQVEV